MSKCIDLTGCKYSRLTVIERANNNVRGEAMWICRCDCGNITRPIRTSALTRKSTKSCGCLKKVSPNRKHNMTGTRLYFVWRDMINRCNNPKVRDYHNYGGRGISVCEEWKEFDPFNEWAKATGYDETAERGKTTLDRIDPQGDYSPGNCRWATTKDQQNNRRNNRRYVVNGRSRTLAELTEEYNISYGTVWKRLQLGWDIETALTKEIKSYHK